ncbi:MAG: DUF86 domain-containing protein [Nanoarchaeota archaeon]|nr:DUF86 domain-containing protein [Nanoarchaeota archaeon]
MSKEPLIFIEHILESIQNIESFIKNSSKNYFLKNKEKQSAVIRQIEIIGEAVKNIPDSFRKKYPDIPWIRIAGMRDKLMHHYFGVDLKTVWKVIKENLPGLKKDILNIKNELKES